MILFPHQKIIKKYKIGGKAQGLLHLQNMDIPVPDFIIIPSETFDNQNFQLNTEDKQTLLNVLSSWNFPKQKVIVRSSVSDEDGLKHSFAGIMESFLHLDFFELILQAITDCVQSAFSERALNYRKQKGIENPILPAVIVQKQVVATSSGVIFTTNPQYPQEMVIHATNGLGIDLVQGIVEPDEFYLWKNDGLINRQKNIHHHSILSNTQLEQIYKLGTKVELLSKYPQDIEFVFDTEKLYFVQTRPITQEIEKVIVYDNSNIQESYCGVTTPLTFSFAQRAYATVYRQTMKSLGLSQSTIAQNEPIIQNLLGLVKGRIYYNINNWYQGLKLLPSFKQNKSDMERMMGLEKPVDFVENQNKTFWQKCKMLPSLLLNLSKLLFGFYKLPISIAHFLSHFRDFYQKFYQQDFSQYSWDDLQNTKKQIDVSLLENWSVPIINDFYVMMSNGKAIRHLKSLGFEAPEEFLSRYFAKKGNVVSTQPFLELQKLATEASKSKELVQLILNFQEQTHTKIESSYPAFFQKIQAFIDSFGDRTIGELKLETHTMRTNPTIFYKYLSNLIKIQDNTPENKFNLHLKAQEELAIKLKGKSIFFKNRTSKILDKLQHAIENRELLRLERTRLFGMYRTLYRTMGVTLFNKGLLDSEEDIFYLYEYEIQHFDTYNLKHIVAERKKEFEIYLQESVESQIIIPFPPIADLKQSQISDEKTLIGTCCVAGIQEGEVMVISNPHENLDVVGKIICALRTDPGWAALFPACKAVLIEKGSALSHSAILLRELGIPTIINIPKITEKIQTGQYVRIDAEKGKIEIL